MISKLFVFIVLNKSSTVSCNKLEFKIQNSKLGMSKFSCGGGEDVGEFRRALAYIEPGLQIQGASEITGIGLDLPTVSWCSHSFSGS